MKKLTHLGIIMDGNRRWAKKKHLPSYQGHYRGYQKVLSLCDWAITAKIDIISIYAFSTENWQRSKAEVAYLMKLAKMVFKKHLGDFNRMGVRLLVSGVNDGLDQQMLELIKQTEKTTAKNKKLTLNICLNYGGRREIIEAIRKIIRAKVAPAKVNEELFKKYMFHDLPDPDMIVRTSGEQRLSNFLTWQSAYSELLFIKKYWPDFSEKDLKKIISTYQKRQRRFGH